MAPEAAEVPPGSLAVTPAALATCILPRHARIAVCYCIFWAYSARGALQRYTPASEGVADVAFRSATEVEPLLLPGLSMRWPAVWCSLCHLR